MVKRRLINGRLCQELESDFLGEMHVHLPHYVNHCITFLAKLLQQLDEEYWNWLPWRRKARFICGLVSANYRNYCWNSEPWVFFKLKYFVDKVIYLDQSCIAYHQWMILQQNIDNLIQKLGKQNIIFVRKWNTSIKNRIILGCREK